ncbi:hypothetical protein HERIO_1230 [Hepatospora eriocheir]|uniref:Uncharacterized protein n=1 Tax=Hepatospora eriocheir TaxID=1081669 RepID=A0A1X0QAS4_9MICR|nr:hypothetical protein HERIO_1230 [Hepatospora eriocheir]
MFCCTTRKVNDREEASKHSTNTHQSKGTTISGSSNKSNQDSTAMSKSNKDSTTTGKTSTTKNSTLTGVDLSNKSNQNSAAMSQSNKDSTTTGKSSTTKNSTTTGKSSTRITDKGDNVSITESGNIRTIETSLRNTVPIEDIHLEKLPNGYTLTVTHQHSSNLETSTYKSSFKYYKEELFEKKVLKVEGSFNEVGNYQIIITFEE